MDRQAQLLRSNSGVSEFSMYSKSQKTGLSERTLSDNGTSVGDHEGSAHGSDAGEGQTNLTKTIANDPIIVGLNGIFDDIYEEIINTG